MRVVYTVFTVFTYEGVLLYLRMSVVYTIFYVMRVKIIRVLHYK